MSNFYEALGRFALTYAHAEAALKIFVIDVVGLERRDGMALFGGMKVGTLQDTIKHIHEARGTALDATAKRALAQLKHIHFMRDMVLHNGFMPSDKAGLLVTTNFISARTPSAAKTYPISVEDLEHMIEDLETINVALLISIKNPPTVQTPGLLALSQKPWLYKPSQPARP